MQNENRSDTCSHPFKSRWILLGLLLVRCWDEFDSQAVSPANMLSVQEDVDIPVQPQARSTAGGLRHPLDKVCLRR